MHNALHCKQELTSASVKPLMTSLGVIRGLPLFFGLSSSLPSSLESDSVRLRFLFPFPPPSPEKNEQMKNKILISLNVLVL